MIGLDSNIIVAMLNEAHPDHQDVADIAEQFAASPRKFSIAAHGLMESFRVLTSLPRIAIAPRIARDAMFLIARGGARIVDLTVDEQLAALERTLAATRHGGAVFDALHVEAAIKARVSKFVTFDVDDFRALWPERAADIVEP